MDVEMGWCDYNSLCRKKEKDIVYGCGRSLGSFPVCPLQRLCSAETQHLFLFLLLPCFPFFPFPLSDTCPLPPLVCFLFIFVYSSIDLTANMSGSAQTRTVRLTVIAADGLVKKDLFFKLPDPFGMPIDNKNFIPIELIYVYSSCCYCGWRTNTYNYCYEEDTEPLLERELWPVTWHTQPR